MNWETERRTERRFLPSVDGFAFRNYRSLYPGMCAGMTAAAKDFKLAGRAIPRDECRPGFGTALYNYILLREAESFSLQSEAINMALGTLKGDAKLEEDNVRGLERISEVLQTEESWPVALIYFSGSKAMLPWQNHQVLAYGVKEWPGGVEVGIYDPNYPLNDTVRLTFTAGEFGLRVMEYFVREDGELRQIKVRGVFLLPYHFKQPPKSLC